MSTVIITGISRGIGLGLAARYLERGESVVGTVRAANDAVAALQREYGDKLFVATADVTDAHALNEAARTVRERIPAADVLVCNAAINPEHAGRTATVGDLSDDHLSATLDVNVVGVQRTVRALPPPARRRRWCQDRRHLLRCREHRRHCQRRHDFLLRLQGGAQHAVPPALVPAGRRRNPGVRDLARLGEDRHGRRQRPDHGGGVDRSDPAADRRARSGRPSLHQPHGQSRQLVGQLAATFSGVGIGRVPEAAGPGPGRRAPFP